MQSTQSQFPGSWHLTIRPEAGTQPQVSFATMFADGSLIVTPPAVEEFPLAPEGAVHVGTGHGEWRAHGSDQAAMAFEAQASNSVGHSLGLGRVDADLVIGESGSRFTGTYTFAFRNAGGEVIATEEGIVEGQKIGLGKLPASVSNREASLSAT